MKSRKTKENVNAKNMVIPKWEQFDEILRNEDGWPLDRVSWRVKSLLNGFEIANKRVLEIGCGAGTFSIYLAIAGASHVIGIDPEGPGSTKGVKYKMTQRIEKLGLSNCEFMPIPFSEKLFSNNSFDLIISYNSINHLHEVTSDFRKDATAYNVYSKIFSEFFRITAPKGMIIISDCSRSNIFSKLRRYGITQPFAKSIEWEKHQVPHVWKNLLKEAGFTPVSQNWYVPAPFRHFPWLIDNYIVNFCTISHFTLRAVR